MSAPASAVPAARLALLAALQAALSPTNLLVCLDEPMVSTADDVVSIGNVNTQVTPLAMIGSLAAGAMIETFTIDVICEAYRGGDNAAAAFGRAAALADQVMAAVRADPTLASSLNIEARPVGVAFESSITTDSGGMNTGRLSRATVQISCTSTL